MSDEMLERIAVALERIATALEGSRPAVPAAHGGDRGLLRDRIDRYAGRVTARSWNCVARSLRWLDDSEPPPPNSNLPWDSFVDWAYTTANGRRSATSIEIHMAGPETAREWVNAIEAAGDALAIVADTVEVPA